MPRAPTQQAKQAAATSSDSGGESCMGNYVAPLSAAAPESRQGRNEKAVIQEPSAAGQPQPSSLSADVPDASATAEAGSPSPLASASLKAVQGDFDRWVLQACV